MQKVLNQATAMQKIFVMTGFFHGKTLPQRFAGLYADS